VDTGADFTSGATNDTFAAVETDAATTDTFTTGDSLVGGGGTDTLSIAVSGATTATTAGVSTTGIETVRVLNNSGVAYTLNAGLMEGLDDVVLVGGTTATTVSGLANIVDLELVNSNVDATVNVAAAAVAGDADSATVTVSGSALTAGLTVNYDGLETVNLDVAGTSGVRTATTNRSITIDSDQLETLNVTGAGNVNVTASFVGAVADAQTATFDASDADGSVSATITKGASAAVSVTMSDQDDLLDYLSPLARQATLKGGDGVDTLRLSSNVTFSPTATTAAAASGVSGFEVLRLAAGVSVDNRALTNNGSIASVVAEGTGGLTSSAALASVTQLASGTFTTTKVTDGAADALALTLAGAGVASTLAAANVEALTVTSAGTAANSLTMSAAQSADLTSLTVSGTQSMTATIGGDLLATVNASGLSGLGKSFTLDASASEADMTVTGAAVTPNTDADTANTITTGEGADTITTGSGKDVINAGDGANVVNAGDGDNTVTTGRNNDSITTGAGDDIINSGLGNDTIVSGAGDDVINADNGNDNITAGDGDDIITLGSGDDTVDAGAGADAIINTDYDDDDVIIGGAGTDTLSRTELAATLTTTQVQAIGVFMDVDIDSTRVAAPQITGVENVYIQVALDAANAEGTAATNESVDFSASSGISNLFLDINDQDLAAGAATNDQAVLTLSDVDAATIHLLDRETNDDLGELVVEGAGQASLTLRGHDFDGGTDLTVSNVDAVTITAYTPTTTAAVGDTILGDVEVDDSDRVTVSIAGVSALVTAPNLDLASLSADSAIAITLSAGSNSTLDIVGDLTSSSEALDTLTVTVSDDGTVDVGGDIIITDSEMSSATITVGVGGLFTVDNIDIEEIEAMTVSVGAAGSFTATTKIDLGGAAATITGAAGSTVTIGQFAGGTTTSPTSFTLTGRGALGDGTTTGAIDISGVTSVNVSGWTDANVNDDDTLAGADHWLVTMNGGTFTSNNAAARVTGGAEDDTITTGAGADVIDAGDGDNVVSSGAGADSITTGAGDDEINAGTGADTIAAGAGADTITITEASTARSSDTLVFASGDSDADNIDVVTGFNAIATNGDKLDFVAAGTTIVDAQTAIDMSITSVIAATDATTAIVAADVINGVLSAGGILTVTGADAAKVDTLDEWLAIAAEMVAEAEDTDGDDSVLLAFEFNGATYVAEFDHDDSADSAALTNLVQLSGVVDVVALSGTAAANTIHIV
jgi:Ca2+-binding RTX toxin-like protein